MKNEVEKVTSTLMKQNHRLKLKLRKFQLVAEQRKEFSRQVNEFMTDMLKSGKLTKEDLMPYFNKKPKQIKN